MNKKTILPEFILVGICEPYGDGKVWIVDEGEIPNEIMVRYSYISWKNVYEDGCFLGKDCLQEI